MASDQTLGFRETLSILRPGPFRRYILGEAASMTGTWMQMMAQGWVVAQLTTSALMLGMVNFVGVIPMLLLSMVGGSFADRFDKRLILQVTLASQIAFASVVGLLIQAGALELWHLLVVAALLGISSSFEMPAASALVPELVDKKDIGRAIAVDRSVFHATRLVGPALAGLCVAKLGAAAAFYVNAVSFVPLMIAVATLPARPAGTKEEEKQRKTGMREGVDYVRSDAPTLGMISLISLTTCLVFPLMVVLMPVYAVHLLKAGPGEMGLLMGVAGVGALTGSVGMLTVSRQGRPRRMAFAAAAIVAAMTGLAAARSVPAAALSVIVLTVGISTLIGLPIVSGGGCRRSPAWHSSASCRSQGCCWPGWST